MTWDDFYDRYSDWSESTLKTRISTLEDIGNGEEVVDVCLEVRDEKIKVQLLRKAMKLGVSFTHDDLMLLDCEIPDSIFEEITRYAGFSVDNPYFDEQNFDWDDFYGACADLPEDMLLRCIPKIQTFGDREEVADAISSLPSPADDALYERAIACGVRFTKKQLELMGREALDFSDAFKSFANISDEQMDDWIKQIRLAEKTADKELEKLQTRKQQRASVQKAIGIGSIIGFFKGLFGKEQKQSKRCNGDCENCPAHYGYRYGRWYYGHGHHRGCEFGGNKGGGDTV